ncbi:MAG: hypothetical protein HY927_05715 [Elusimicrobia bacterium]|nr:hypothetical protein [Elusimicrobiota bacterium]
MNANAMKRRFSLNAVLAGAICAVSAASASAVEYIPVCKASLLGGQYFLKGTNANVNANGSLNVAPVVRFSDQWSLIPHYWFNYQGTKGVGDGVGAGTLWQQQMDHKVGFTGIFSPAATDWKHKHSVSYRRNFMKETLDESWGYGLFDYDKLAVGIEAENVYNDPFSYRLGFDAYKIGFPNYKSLESQTGVDPAGNPLNRELTSVDVLDTWNFQLSAAGSRPYPYEDPVVSLHATYSVLWQVYNDQRLVNRLGQFNTNKPFGRQDFQQNIGLAVGYPTTMKMWGRDLRVSYTMGVTAGHNGSNQNSFDAARTQFIHDAYSYYSFGVGPNWSVAWGDKKRPSSVNLSFQFNHQQYTGRLAQNSEGVYTGSNQWQDRYIASLGQSYPIATGFNLVARANFLWAASNQAMEKTYLYTYRTANYMMGFTYEY